MREKWDSRGQPNGSLQGGKSMYKGCVMVKMRATEDTADPFSILSDGIWGYTGG